MRTSRSPRIIWTLATGVAGVGLLGSAAVAAALSNAPAVPAHANAHATLSASDDSSSSDSSSSESSESSESSSSESGSPSSTPVGPDATGPAAYGLCTAYAHAKVHGKSVTHSIAFRNLAAAAGGVAQIDAYCAAIPHPGSSDASSSESDAPPSSVPSTDHPAGRPSVIPSHSHPGRP